MEKTLPKSQTNGEDNLIVFLPGLKKLWVRGTNAFNLLSLIAHV